MYGNNTRHLAFEQDISSTLTLPSKTLRSFATLYFVPLWMIESCSTMTVVDSVLNGEVPPSWTSTRTDDIMSSRPVFSRTCPATHHRGLRPTAPPEKCLTIAVLPSPVVPHTPWQSPAVTLFPYSLVLNITGSHSPFSRSHIFVFSLFTH